MTTEKKCYNTWKLVQFVSNWLQGVKKIPSHSITSHHYHLFDVIGKYDDDGGSLPCDANLTPMQ
jgi:hypothetical protein